MTVAPHKQEMVPTGAVATVEIWAVIGPTASGKSALALALAERLGAEILSVDSMQVYRGMDLGTAKPTADERRRVVHHGIDLVEPTEAFTAARFVEHADAVLADARRRRVPVVAVGGTPLYFKSLFEGLFEGPAADESLRASLREASPESLHERLRAVDPEAASRLHVNDTRRVIRALEVFELTGQTITEHQQQWGREPRHHARWVGLHWEREALNRRINARAKQMFQSGWPDEVRTLLARHGSLGPTASEATGYAELIRHLQGKQSLDDALEQTKIATRQLARRQIKWFRRFEHVQWVDGSLSVEGQLDLIARPSRIP